MAIAAQRIQRFDELADQHIHPVTKIDGLSLFGLPNLSSSNLLGSLTALLGAGIKSPSDLLGALKLDESALLESVLGTSDITKVLTTSLKLTPEQADELSDAVSALASGDKQALTSLADKYVGGLLPPIAPVGTCKSSAVMSAASGVSATPKQSAGNSGRTLTGYIAAYLSCGGQGEALGSLLAASGVALPVTVATADVAAAKGDVSMLNGVIKMNPTAKIKPYRDVGDTLSKNAMIAPQTKAKMAVDYRKFSDTMSALDPDWAFNGGFIFAGRLTTNTTTGLKANVTTVTSPTTVSTLTHEKTLLALKTAV